MSYNVLHSRYVCIAKLRRQTALQAYTVKDKCASAKVCSFAKKQRFAKLATSYLPQRKKRFILNRRFCPTGNDIYYNTNILIQYTVMHVPNQVHIYNLFFTGCVHELFFAVLSECARLYRRCCYEKMSVPHFQRILGDFSIEETHIRCMVAAW